MWAPFIIFALAVEILAEDKHHLIKLYGKVLGVLFAVMTPFAAYYPYKGWEWVLGSTLLLGVPKACGSFMWAKHCFEDAAHGEIEPRSSKLCRDETALGAFELLFVTSVFWIMLNTKHDVHPRVSEPEKNRLGRRAARPGRENFVRRTLQAIWKERDLIWWSCVTLWVSCFLGLLTLTEKTWLC